MKRITLYLSNNRDFDLINLMMNPTIDFNKMAKNMLVNYVRGDVVYVAVPPKTNYVPVKHESKKTKRDRGYRCVVSFGDREEDVFDFLQSVDEGKRSNFIKQVIRFSIKGGLLDYYFDNNDAPVVISQRREPETRDDIKVVKKPQKVTEEIKEEAVISKPEVVTEEPVITSESNDFDLFGELAALGAAPQ